MRARGIAARTTSSGSSPWSWTHSIPSSDRAPAISSIEASTTTAITRARPSASRAIARATSGEQRRLLPLHRFTPSASTPSASALSASSAVVIPQILIAVTMLSLREVVTPDQGMFNSSLTFWITCGAWIGLVMYALAPSAIARWRSSVEPSVVMMMIGTF